jgi:Tol biopolymer transport system component
VVLSPDERNAALEVLTEEGSEVWIMDLARGVTSLVSAGPGSQTNPVWNPDGRSLTFSSEAGGTPNLRRKGLRATAPETILQESPVAEYGESWAPDGSLLFIRQATPGQQSVWALPAGGGGPPEPILDSGAWVDEPQPSPDGRWLAYVSRESGRSEVYVEPFRRDGERVRVSVEGGGQPKWRSDGAELFFADLDGHLMSVDFRVVENRAEVDLPTELFALGSYTGEMYDDYAPSADGQRFLVKLAVGGDDRVWMHVVTNWPSLLPEPAP